MDNQTELPLPSTLFYPAVCYCKLILYVKTGTTYGLSMDNDLDSDYLANTFVNWLEGTVYSKINYNHGISMRY